MSSDLVVAIQDTPVGVIAAHGAGASFSFFDRYLNTPQRSVLGQTFETNPRRIWRTSNLVPNWFRNLLPEEGSPLRSFLSRSLEVDPRNEMRLLGILGMDLPGAVTVTHADQWDDLTGLTGRPVAKPSANDAEPAPGLRFSVAGLQMKLSLSAEVNTLRVPNTGELGNSYAKFATGRADLTCNEYVTMRVGQELGLNVPSISLRPLDQLDQPLPGFIEAASNAPMFLIQRFDRDAQGRRIHIEDLNQVRDNPPDSKYSGATQESLGRVVHSLCGEDDFWEYFRRVLFFIAMGNEDGHLKNWSLIYRDGATPRLSPMYDAVSTIQYPELIRENALRIGRSRRLEDVDLQVMLRLARKAGADEQIAEQETVRVLAALPAAEARVREDASPSREFWRTLDEYRRGVPLLRSHGV